ncbi:DUF4221 family protein [Algoriphagus yeomjeoni]|uniref:Uncharacterized protein DUF4221 n=1 Tax=Algoriphagus yeomjeoni TaxID=291403 RepID=A0A327PUL2_9BACT|nr:DUF4221 family protein [Algoriphagus yeomjeoni]RAI95174.1 uncharacterized protein DUF4221 [Algoriphagus yeomjeoni]
MERQLATLFLAILFSCGGKETQISETGNILENLTYLVDTVMIDSKEKLFELSWGPHSSSVTEDGKYLFLFNSKFNQIQQINLDKLEWEKDFDFEVEGPNGISDVVTSTQPLGQGKFLIKPYRKMGVFDEEGVKLKDYSIPSLPINSELEELENSVILSKDQKSLFSLPGIRYFEPRTLARIDLQTYEVQNFPIKEMDWILDLKIGTSTRYSFDEYMYLKELNEQILVLSPSSSAFYRYDLKTDSLTYHSFVHQLTPIANDIKLKNIIETDEEYREELSRYAMGIKFGSPMWDKTRSIYFRIGIKPTQIDGPFQINSSKVFLYVYDQKFNLIGETLIPEISTTPQSPFFKDGKLYSYVNVEDELGFAVFTFDF